MQRGGDPRLAQTGTEEVGAGEPTARGLLSLAAFVCLIWGLVEFGANA